LCSVSLTAASGRERGTQAPVEFEIPRSVITKAIVNAVGHNGFVQVSVFADRIEVWNPGELPPGLTPGMLRKPHGPIPRNPLIAEPLFRVKYVEKAGTGTTDMIADCRAAGLPEPDFEQRGPHFVVTLWRDWLPQGVMDRLGLSDHERRLVLLLKGRSRISNTDYREEFVVSKPTASRHLEALVVKGILTRIGAIGRGAYYVLSRKGLMTARWERDMYWACWLSRMESGKCP